ncbi:MAG: cyclic nucleotide-binding domain-containing protein, partial [Pseudomonadales bacterium]|nr:cyclic nucleotide-binding domain-containing protein [Pseudomonadales bacterium]
MADASNLLTAKILKKFTPLDRLNDKQLVLLASHHEIKQYKRKATVIVLGSSDNKEYFLIQGKLLLTASDGKQQEVEGGTATAMRPIAHLQPRQYTAKVLETATFLIIDWTVLAQFVREAPKDSTEVLEVQLAVSSEP